MPQGHFDSIRLVLMNKPLLLGALVFGAALTSCSPLENAAPGTISPDTRGVVVDGVEAPLMREVSRGQPNLSGSVAPASFEVVDAEPNCRMPRPSGDAKLAYVYTYGGGVPTPLQYIADGRDAAVIAERMQRTKALATFIAEEGTFTEWAVARGAVGFFKGNAVELARRVDVLVTETDTPVFLVLTSYDAILWNIQTAPGVEIDGIVVSGYEGGAIANGVSNRRTGFMGFDGAPNRTCYLKGRGRPIPVEERVAGAYKRNPDFDADHDMVSYELRWQQDYREGQRFFAETLTRMFGKNADWLLFDARGGVFDAVLIGSVPDQPFEQLPIERLQLPSYVEPFWGSREAAFEYFGLE